MSNLTRAQERVLVAFRRLSEGGVAPTIEEVAAALHLSKSTVHFHVQHLIELGALKPGSAGASRSVTVVAQEDRGMEAVRLLRSWMDIAGHLVPTALVNQTRWLLR